MEIMTNSPSKRRAFFSTNEIICTLVTLLLQNDWRVSFFLVLCAGFPIGKTIGSTADGKIAMRFKRRTKIGGNRNEYLQRVQSVRVDAQLLYFDVSAKRGKVRIFVLWCFVFFFIVCYLGSRQEIRSRIAGKQHQHTTERLGRAKFLRVFGQRCARDVGGRRERLRRKGKRR